MRHLISPAASLRVNGDSKVSVKAIVQKLLSLFNYRLVRIARKSELGLDVVDRKQKIFGHDPAKSQPHGALENWFQSSRPLKIDKWLHYFPIYERHFASFKGKPVKVLEIGVFKGGSLAMWKEYFGANSVIVGLDIDQYCKQFENKDSAIHVRIGDQESQSFLASVSEEFGPFDIVIDDGGHTTSQQIQSFLQLYFSAMKPDGVYLVEDLHTNYWREFMTHPDGLTFVELTCKLVHQLHDVYRIHADEDIGSKMYHFDAKNADRVRTVEVSNFCAQTDSVHYYDSIIVFERAEKMIPYHELR